MAGYRHEAVLYAGDDGFLDMALPFVRDGVAAGDKTLVAVPGRRLGALRDALGPDADHVELADMTTIGRNPACIIAAWHRFIAANPGQRLRGIGEPVFAERTPAEVDECHRHEAALNVAFPADVDLWLVCPYDTTTLDAAVVERALHTHPHVRHGDTVQASDRYDHARIPHLVFADEAPPPPPDAAAFTVDERGTRALRRAGAAEALRLGLPVERVGDAAIVVTELAENTIRHGGGVGTLHVWRSGDAIVCQSRDRGVITEPLAGRLPPPADALGGRGLWLVNQLCHLVQVRSAGNDTVITAHLPID